MDVSKTRQKYKQYTCLCLSVMGQRRFRVSMGVLIASPEAGTASVNIIPHMKNHNAISDDSSKSFVSTISEKNAINQSALKSAMNYNCSNILNKDSHKHMVLMENGVLSEMSTSTIPESCQFPYYRSNKSDGGYPDAVLVKDVGVSCMLLNKNVSNTSLPETRTIVDQLKREYYDLSNITSKITAYTKDILNNLSKRKQRKHQLLRNVTSSKHAVASQYADSKGNICLKLRLLNNTETQYTSQHAIKNCESPLYKSNNVGKNVHSKHSKIDITDKEKIGCEENTKSKYEKHAQTMSHKSDVEANTSTSSAPSTSSLYNYLTMKEKIPANQVINYKLIKLDNIQKYRNSKNFSDNKDQKDHVKRCNPVLFTNWREISQSNKYRNKTLSITSNESQQTVNTRDKTFQEELFTSKTINDIPDTKFHTVNIRIIKQNKKHL